MKIKIFIFLAFAIISCGQTKNEKSDAESIVEKMEIKFNAEKSIVVEKDENVKGQGFKRILNIDFINCKNIDLLDRSLKTLAKSLALELKNNIPGSERIDKYKIKLIKDPNDKTPSKSGLNVNQKGFTFNREDLQ